MFVILSIRKLILNQNFHDGVSNHLLGSVIIGPSGVSNHLLGSVIIGPSGVSNHLLGSVIIGPSGVSNNPSGSVIKKCGVSNGGQ